MKDEQKALENNIDSKMKERIDKVALLKAKAENARVETTSEFYKRIQDYRGEIRKQAE